jgi:hypothetical protein
MTENDEENIAAPEVSLEFIFGGHTLFTSGGHGFILFSNWSSFKDGQPLSK